jgi:hypothetical protein
MRLAFRLFWRAAFIVMVAMLIGWITGALLIEAEVWKPVGWA